jgi:SAM-dependent methyltransferase
MGHLTHSPSDLEQIYKSRFAGKSVYRRRVWQVLVAYFTRWIPQNATVLDLGCGYCEFINHVQAGLKYGMDLNPGVLSHADPGVNILQQDCSEPWTISPGSLDVVFTSNFFEHLPTKSHLERTLIQAHRFLKNGGCLIALGPNIKYVPGRYWDFFDHYLPLTELALAEVLKKCGFSIEVCADRFLPYTMSDGREYPIWTLQMYLAFPPLWRLFGKQFLVVARKPA